MTPVYKKGDLVYLKVLTRLPIQQFRVVNVILSASPTNGTFVTATGTFSMADGSLVKVDKTRDVNVGTYDGRVIQRIPRTKEDRNSNFFVGKSVRVIVDRGSKLDLVAMPIQELVLASNGSAPGIKISNKVFSWVEHLGCYAIIRSDERLYLLEDFPKLRGNVCK